MRDCFAELKNSPLSSLTDRISGLFLLKGNLEIDIAFLDAVSLDCLICHERVTSKAKRRLQDASMKSALPLMTNDIEACITGK